MEDARHDGASPNDGLVYAMRPLADRFTRAVHARSPEATEILEDLAVDPHALFALAIALADLRPQLSHEDGLVDVTAVDRVLAGDTTVRLREPEMVEVAKILICEGGTRTKLARLLRVNGSRTKALWEQAQAVLAYERRGVAPLPAELTPEARAAS